jgi:ubiquinone/menaquinone biosynthesis C-methylase UbiE
MLRHAAAADYYRLADSARAMPDLPWFGTRMSAVPLSLGTGMLRKIDYDNRLHAVYARGRSINPARLSAWMSVFAARLPARRPLTIIDLGSGIGRFTPTLAEEFGGPIFGVEPSQRMLDIADAQSRHPAVTYLNGSAEKIPLPDECSDAVIMFLSLHHVSDRAATAGEVARVLRPNGRVLIRSDFADRMPDLRWHDFFPRAPAIEQQMFPTTTEVEDLFARVGLARIALEPVREQFASSLAETAAKLRLRAISTFEHMTETEIAEGFAAMDRAVAAEIVPQPDEGISDLLVLG